MKIVITGGAGFLGSQLGYKLTGEGHDVTLIDDLSFGYEDNLVVDGRPVGKFHRADIRSGDIEPLFAGCDAVFHLAGLSALPVCQEDPNYAVSVNVAGTANVLEMARRQDVKRIIFSSTSATYERNKQMPFREEDPVDPHLVYSLSKLQSELLCKAYAQTYGMEIVILRYFNVYGPHQDFRRKSPPLISYIIRELLAGRPPVLHSSGDQARDYVYMDDVNRMNMICLTHPKAPGGPFNVASNTQASVKQIYAMIAKALGTDIQATYRPSAHFWEKYPRLFTSSRPLPLSILENEVNKTTLGSFEKSQRVLGWRPQVTMEEGIRRTVEYARKLSSETA